jgi:hypothetical protein
MMDSNDIKVRMSSLDMIQNDNKRVWMAPELEVLDERKTFSGPENYGCEDGWCGDQNDFGLS